MPLFINQKVINESLYFHYNIYCIFTIIILEITSEILWLGLQETSSLILLSYLFLGVLITSYILILLMPMFLSILAEAGSQDEYILLKYYFYVFAEMKWSLSFLKAV